MATRPVPTADGASGRTGAGALALAALVVVSAAAVAAPAAAQSDTVTLTVSVVVERTGESVAEATIVASWDGGSTRGTTAGNGKAFLDVPAGQKVTLDVEHPDYVRNFPYNVTRTSDGEVTLDVAQRARLTIVAEDGEGAPVEGATVRLTSGARVVDVGRTDAEGRFRSRDIERGEYDVRVAKPGFYTRTLTADPGGPLTKRVTLESGTVQYEFRVRDDHFDPPRPVANATVRVGSLATLRTLDDGRASVGIPVNTVQRVRVSKPGYDPAAKRVTVGESGGRVTLLVQRSRNLTVSADARRVVAGERVTVRVRNAYGEPAADVAVLRNGSVVARTDGDGTAAVPIEERGSYEIRARAGPVTSAPVVVEGVVPAGTATATPTPTATPAPTPTASEEGSGALAPGFGPPTALLALAVLVVAALARRRQSRR
ncbi:MAG: carboxypeptidase regulatory-like domain-containing protein [Haloferacaceae archaeon]